MGSPSFVGEPPGDGLARAAEARRSIRQYVRNAALWLGGRSPIGPCGICERPAEPVFA
jgi:hypothetical protein